MHVCLIFIIVIARTARGERHNSRDYAYKLIITIALLHIIYIIVYVYRHYLHDIPKYSFIKNKYGLFLYSIKPLRIYLTTVT